MGSVGFTIGAYHPHGDFHCALDRGMNGWVEHYQTEGMAGFCPFAPRLLTSLAPFQFDDVLRAADATKAGQEVIASAAEYDIKHGYYLPQASKADRRNFVFIRTEKEIVDLDLLNALSLVAIAAHSRLRTLQSSGHVTDLPKLSVREVEVLRWLAQGKSTLDVGDILGISESTVRFHYNRVALEFGTLNRTQTVVEALKRGLLSLY